MIERHLYVLVAVALTEYRYIGHIGEQNTSLND